MKYMQFFIVYSKTFSIIRIISRIMSAFDTLKDRRVNWLHFAIQV